MARRYGLHNPGAGSSASYDALDGPHPGTHWYNVMESWHSRYAGIHWLFRWALEHPGQVGKIDTKDEFTFAYYDPERNQVLSTHMRCPGNSGHHLYQTCKCCGQYG